MTVSYDVKGFTNAVGAGMRRNGQLPRQLLLRGSTSCVHAVVSNCHGATTRAQSFRVLLTPLTYIPVGEVFTLQTLPDCEDDQFTSRVGNLAGFSLPQGTLS